MEETSDARPPFEDLNESFSDEEKHILRTIEEEGSDPIWQALLERARKRKLSKKPPRGKVPAIKERWREEADRKKLKGVRDDWFKCFRENNLDQSMYACYDIDMRHLKLATRWSI